jgi:hypothetical protein
MLPALLAMFALWPYQGYPIALNFLTTYECNCTLSMTASSLYHIPFAQRGMQADFGIPIVPHKRSRREVLVNWLNAGLNE